MGQKPYRKKKGKTIKMDEREELAKGTSKKSTVQKKRKREGLITINEGARCRRKKCRTGASTKEKIVKPVDYISKLPEHIIHHILELLRCKKDAARTCILSKRWRDLWVSFSNLIFDQRKFQPEERNSHNPTKSRNVEVRKKFEQYVDNTLHRHMAERSSIQKFILHMTSYDLKVAPRIDQWINAATKIDIQELNLHIPVKKNKHYSLPQSVFASKTITALRIHGCKLESCNDVKFSRLQKLCLGKLSVSEETIGYLIRCCPLIEDLRLIDCTGLSKLQVTNLFKLKRVDLHFCQGLKKVEIQAPKLEAFWYYGKKLTLCVLDLSACKSLKNLTLGDANMKDELFQNYLSTFPVLEKLVLCKCDVLKNITISSYWLKTLVLRNCRNLSVADIDTPNLISFEFKSEKMPLCSLKPTNLRDAKLYFEQKEHSAALVYGYQDREHFAQLEEFLENFDFSRGVKLVARFRKNIIIYEEPKKIFLPPSYCLKLDVIKSATSFEDLLDNVLRAWQPETLSIISSPRSNGHKIAHQKIVNREKKPVCCTYNSSFNKCWLHFLENVKIEDLANRSTGRSTSGSSSNSEFVDWLRASPAIKLKTTCLRFNWKSRKHMKEMQAKA